MASPTSYAHPLTGEVLETEAEFSEAIREMEQALAPSRNAYYDLIRARSERFEAWMPMKRRHRTETQEKVTRCPRCGGRIDDAED